MTKRTIAPRAGVAPRTPVPFKPLPFQSRVADALKALRGRVTGIEAFSDAGGFASQLICRDPGGLSKGMIWVAAPPPEELADATLAFNDVSTIFQLKEVRFAPQTKRHDLPNLGSMVGYKQVLHVPGRDKPVTARKGWVQVFVRDGGRVYLIQSTLRHGTLSPDISLSAAAEESLKVKAINAALKAARLTSASGATVTAEFVASLHEGVFDPCFEVTVVTRGAHSINREYLVKVKGDMSVEIVFDFDRRHGAEVTTKVFLTVPDPSQPLANFVRDDVISNLPDPKVLVNRWAIMKVKKGDNWVTVTANPDGNFNFPVGSPEFSACNVFVWITQQCEAQALLGAKIPAKPVAVFIDDPDVKNNAYDDSHSSGNDGVRSWDGEIHMGVGTGGRALAVHESYDGGIPTHEHGHQEVHDNAPGGDLLGDEGAGAHEGFAGDAASLATELEMLILFGKSLYGIDFSADWLKKNRNFFMQIGKYARKGGIRNQDNQQKYPDDLVGEPHGDGLIIGAAWAEMLFQMSTANGVDMKAALADFRKLRIRVIQHLPMGNTTFRDILVLALTADREEFGGKYGALITAAHALHGISTEKPLIDVDAFLES